MPWKYKSKTLNEGKAWIDDNGYKHPYNWASLWSNDDKTNWGVSWENASASEATFDTRFYSGRQSDGTLIPHSLTDVLWVDGDGNAINDPLTGQQGKTKGLKTIAIEVAKTQANGFLIKHDWYIVRNAEKSTAIPSAVTTFRDAVRTSCAAIETSITNASDLAAFIALYDVPMKDGKPNGNAPINDWPDEI